jgi:hypothetical protein
MPDAAASWSTVVTVALESSVAGTLLGNGQDRAVGFHSGTLGFELLMDAPLPQIGGRWIVSWPGVPPMFTFRDQDGNTLYVVQE